MHLEAWLVEGDSGHPYSRRWVSLSTLVGDSNSPADRYTKTPLLAPGGVTEPGPIRVGVTACHALMLFVLDGAAQGCDTASMNQEPTSQAAPEELINEAASLREEDSRARYDADMAEMDRRDRAGPHWSRRD